MEQLNSNWSERNMEQKTKMESMLKEVDELKRLLVQAEERIQSQKGTTEELNRTNSNEVLHVFYKSMLFLCLLIALIELSLNTACV